MQDSRYYIPLAPIQEHFWTAAEAGGSQTECAALRVHGPLDPTALREALRALLARHEILRSTVTGDRDGPAMRVRPVPDEPPLTWLDLTALPAEQRETALHEALSGFAEEAVELAEGPLARFLVIGLGARDHAFAIAVHHLVADATAVRIILSEVSRDYLAALDGARSPVAEPELQYGDFAEWERSVLLPAAEKADAAFWRKTLHDAPAGLDLRPDRPRPPVKGTRGRRAEFRFEDSIRPALLDFVREHRTTPYAVSLAAFTALAVRSTGAEDLVLGVLTANRSVPEIERLVGQFANTLPLRIAVPDDPRLAELTARCGRIVTAAIDHGRLPLSRVIELARPERDTSRTPLIQHLFLPRVDAIGDTSFCGSPAEPVEVRRERGRFDTIVEVEVSLSGVRVWVEYDTALYTDRGIAELMRDYERILKTWLARPDTPLSRLPLGPVPGDGPPWDLASALGLTASDTVLLHNPSAPAPASAPASAEASASVEAVRAAAVSAGASVVDLDPQTAPPVEGTVALVPSTEFGAYVTNSNMRTLIVDDAVSPEDLARLREDPGRRVLRLIRLPDGTLLSADFTGLPETWPILRGGGAGPYRIGDDDSSPYTPRTLRLGHIPTPLVARWNPEGDIELVEGVKFTARKDAAPDQRSPDDPLLALMCELWAEALQHPEVHPHDDFFVLGGYSMIATRLVAELNDTLGISVRIRTLFENPTPASFVSELRRLHPHLDDLLALIASAPDLDPRPETEAEPPAREEGEVVPLLAAQRQLWLAQQADPGSLTHTIPLLLRIDGALDEDALCAAVGDVVARQAGLRGVFIEVGGEPVQRIVPFRGFEVPVVELRHLEPEERAERNRLLEEETAYGGFDLTTGPLLRARLVRLGDEQYVLHLLFHHLVTDEVSMTVFMRELSEFYQARTEGRPARLPSLEVGFAEIARAELETLAGPEGERLRRFWTRTLAGAPRLVVPTDRPRPEKPAFTGEFLELRGPLALAEALGDFARERRTTAFTVFCSVVVALLHRLTGQSDLILGVPTENRGRRGAELLIGCFLNVVPLRVDCSGDPSFAELVGRVGAGLLRSYEHQGLPFAEIVEAVRPERLPGAHPIYQITCELQLTGWMPLDLPGCRVSYELVSHGTARYDLSFHTLMRPDALSVMLEVNTELWNRETGLTYLDRILELLTRVTAHPELRLSDLGLRPG